MILEQETVEVLSSENEEEIGIKSTFGNKNLIIKHIEMYLIIIFILKL